MIITGHSDAFIIINGPDDGLEFPVVRTPSTLGSDPDCTVHVRLDPGVAPVQAELRVVAGGYRIRRVAPGALMANGRRVGAYRSRVLRHDEILRVGNTMLTLECAPEGLANRGSASIGDSDFAWAAARFSNALARMAAWIVTRLWRLCGAMIEHWFLTLTVVLALMALFPGLRSLALYWINRFIHRMTEIFPSR